jgi:hypothetical protein
MKRALFLCTLLFTTSAAFAQTTEPGFGMTSTEVRDQSSYELDKPAIPDADIGNNPTNTVIPRPIYLVWRYYSCTPWFRWHVRDVYTSLVPAGEYAVEVDTANDVPDDQIVKDINHAAYGLYCLRVVICVPWDRWQRGFYPQFYVRLHYNAPYWCWVDHWWYYWRAQQGVYTVRMDGRQEVPANTSPATGSGTLILNAGDTLSYNIPYSGLVAPYTASHIHGPAGPGTNAPVLIPLTNVQNPPGSTTSGTLTGTTPALTAAQMGYLNNNFLYVNIHSQTFPGGEIRGQVLPAPAIWCPYGPTWIPVLRWTRCGTLWGLTVTHPYCYPWVPTYQPRPFCLYGLRHYFTPIVDPRQPAPVPFVSALNSRLQYPWQYYHYRPFNFYWPYTPYCARWYWWRCAPFYDYWWIPPIVQCAVWVGDQPPGEFPMDPIPIPGTAGLITSRAAVLQAGDINGDGYRTLSDLMDYRATVGAPPSQDALQDPPMP